MENRKGGKPHQSMDYCKIVVCKLLEKAQPYKIIADGQIYLGNSIQTTPSFLGTKQDLMKKTVSVLVRKIIKVMPSCTSFNPSRCLRRWHKLQGMNHTLLLAWHNRVNGCVGRVDDPELIQGKSGSTRGAPDLILIEAC